MTQGHHVQQGSSVNGPAPRRDDGVHSCQGARRVAGEAGRRALIRALPGGFALVLKLGGTIPQTLGPAKAKGPKHKDPNPSSGKMVRQNPSNHDTDMTM